MMPESIIGLNTSKRKFYKLLDNISSSKAHLPAPERNASSTTLTAEPPSKRFRLLGRDKARPITAPSDSSRPLTAGARERPKSSIFAVNSSAKARPKSSVSEKNVTAEIQKTPNYAPWSHEQFLMRLKSFADVRNWTPKPVAIGEVEWAKRGWTVVGKGTVGCKGGCEKRIVVKVQERENEDPSQDKDEKEDEEDWWMGDVEREMVNRYHDLIANGHYEECLWRRAGCKEDIYRIKMADPGTWQRELRERYLSLLAVENGLPARLDLRIPEGDKEEDIFDVGGLAQIIPSSILERRTEKGKENATATANDRPSTPLPDDDEEDQPAENVNKIALALAIIGWSGQSQNTVQLAYCTKCFQRAGLWLFCTKSGSSTSDVADEPLLFNPIEQHREHCPWKNPASQCALGSLEGLAGWQVLVTLIKGYRRHDKTPKKPRTNPNSVFDGSEDGDIPIKTREELDKEDNARRGRLQRLKRAFTVTKKK